MAAPLKHCDADIQKMQEYLRSVERQLEGENDKARRDAMKAEIEGLKKSIDEGWQPGFKWGRF